MNTHRAALAAVLALTVTSLAACGDDTGDGSGGPEGAAGSGGSGRLQVVASTNVYGDIATQIAGDRADVTSIITSSAQDPHEYEATAQDRLALDDADLVIENGGGYDPFMDSLLDGASGTPVVIDAVDVSGLAPGADEDEGHDDASADADADADGHDHVEGFNEHVWYDFHAVKAVAGEIEARLSALSPDDTATFEANLTAFTDQVAGLEASATKVAATADGRGVAITEPVPLYLLSEVGLVNQTPEEFSEAVEEGTDVPPRVLQETLDLVSGGTVALLAYNAQTADGTTEEVRDAAEIAGVPVVDFTETLPDGDTYISWQQDNLDHLAEALG